MQPLLAMVVSGKFQVKLDLDDRCSEFKSEFQNLDLEKIIDSGEKAVSILLSYQNYFHIPCFGKHDDDGNPNRWLSTSLFMASILNVMGIACSKLKSYDQSLVYLKRAEEILPDLESYNASCCVDCWSVIFHVNQFELYKVKLELCRLNPDIKLIKECPDHMNKIFEIKNQNNNKDEDCFDLGDPIRDASFAYQLRGKFREARRYLRKSSEKYGKSFDYEEVDYRQFRRFLSLMFSEAMDYENALEQNELYLAVLENMGNISELLYAKVERGRYLIDVGGSESYDVAIVVLNSVVTHTDAEKMLVAKAFQFLALACFHSRKFDDAIKHLESSSEILDKLEINPQDQLQRRLFEEHYDRRFSLIRKIYEGKQAIILLEDLLGILGEKFGQDCLEAGCCCYVLGKTCLMSDTFERAEQYFARARHVFDERLGPSDLKRLRTHSFLAVTYAKMRRFDSAIKLQEDLIEHLKGLGPSQQNFLDDATRKLDQMKGISCEVAKLEGISRWRRKPVVNYVRISSTQSKDDEDFPARDSL